MAEYRITCKRCGKVFTSKAKNSLFCSFPSPYPEDKGKNCKELQRLDTKNRSKKKGKIDSDRMDEGAIIKTDEFGYIQRSEYVERFQDFVMEKLGLASYTEYQAWSEKNSDEFSELLAYFQNKTGIQPLSLKGLDKAVIELQREREEEEDFMDYDMDVNLNEMLYSREDFDEFDFDDDDDM